MADLKIDHDSDQDSDEQDRTHDMSYLADLPTNIFKKTEGLTAEELETYRNLNIGDLEILEAGWREFAANHPEPTISNPESSNSNVPVINPEIVNPGLVDPEGVGSKELVDSKEIPGKNRKTWAERRQKKSRNKRRVNKKNK